MMDRRKPSKTFLFLEECKFSLFLYTVNAKYPFICEYSLYSNFVLFYKCQIMFLWESLRRLSYLEITQRDFMLYLYWSMM